MKKQVFFLLLLLSKPLLAGILNPQTFTLPNGLEVIVIENHRAPLVNHQVIYKVGSMDDPMGKVGLSHFLEHLMFRGTPGHAAHIYMQAIAEMGGEANAHTSPFATVYEATVQKEFLPKVMALEAERMRELELADEFVQTEKQVVLEERRMRSETQPIQQLMETVSAHLRLHSQLRIPTIGWAHEIANFTRQDALDFYNTWYTPNNAILLLTGDITLDEAKALATQYYADVPISAHPVRHQLTEPKRYPVTVGLTYPHKDVQTPLQARFYLVPNAMTNPQQALTLSILCHALGEGVTGYLYKALVDTGLATDVSVQYDPYIMGESDIHFTLMPSPGVSMEKLHNAFMRTMQLIAKQGLPADAIEASKKHLITSQIYAHDDSLASLDSHALGAGASLDYLDNWPTLMKKVTTEDVNKLLKTLMARQDYLEATLLPEERP